MIGIDDSVGPTQGAVDDERRVHRRSVRAFGEISGRL
jgi:hypothetical protein